MRISDWSSDVCSSDLLKLEEGPPPALTLQPVIGQRKASKSTVQVGGQHRSNGYVGGHSTADEGRELRRFDNVREDRGRGRGRKPHGGLTVRDRKSTRLNSSHSCASSMPSSA